MREHPLPPADEQMLPLAPPESEPPRADDDKRELP
jgi:hypothetical protein